MPFVKANGARIYWRFDGSADKPVLLALNPIGTDLGVWDRALPSLLEDFRVLRLDTRGHGASDAPAGDYTLEQLASDAVAVLDAAGVSTVLICGVSLGGMVAIELALRCPERIAALVLVCTSAEVDRTAWQERLDAVRRNGMAAVADAIIARLLPHHFLSTHPEVAGTLRTGLLSMEADGYAGCSAAIRDMTLINRLPSIEVPTLVIYGTKDVALPFEGHGDRVFKSISGACALPLDSGHLPILETPNGFSGAVRTFFQTVANDRGRATANETLNRSGMSIRRKVLGDTWVDKAEANRTAFNSDFQDFITRYAWDGIWSRPGLDHRTRRLLVLAITAALGRWEEFRLHARAALEQGGCTMDELKETLMQTAVYAGVPAANTAFAEASAVLSALANSTKT